MPMERIDSRDRAFMATQSVEMRKFWGTFPRKVLTRPGAGRTRTAKLNTQPALNFHRSSNSMYVGSV